MNDVAKDWRRRALLAEQRIEEIEARLATAEQERDALKEALRPAFETTEAALDSLARCATAEACAEAALRFIVAHPNGVGDHHPAFVARAALACPPQPFDPETSPGMTDLMVSPQAIDEALAACSPPE